MNRFPISEVGRRIFSATGIKASGLGKVVQSMKRLLTTISLLISAVTGYCCKCEDPNSVQQEYKYSDLVVYGQVISIFKVTPAQTIDTTRLNHRPIANGYYKATDFLHYPLVLAVRLKVLKGYKNAKTGQIVTIFTPLSGASCGYKDFVAGQLFIVYGAYRSFYLEVLFSNYNSFKDLELANTFWTNQCSRTTEYIKEEIAALDKMYN